MKLKLNYYIEECYAEFELIVSEKIDNEIHIHLIYLYISVNPRPRTKLMVLLATYIYAIEQ